jgi:hypothetical protein
MSTWEVGDMWIWDLELIVSSAGWMTSLGEWNEEIFRHENLSDLKKDVLGLGIWWHFILFAALGLGIKSFAPN